MRKRIQKRGMGNEKGWFDAIEIVFQDIWKKIKKFFFIHKNIIYKFLYSSLHNAKRKVFNVLSSSGFSELCLISLIFQENNLNVFSILRKSHLLLRKCFFIIIKYFSMESKYNKTLFKLECFLYSIICGNQNKTNLQRLESQNEYEYNIPTPYHNSVINQ